MTGGDGSKSLEVLRNKMDDVTVDMMNLFLERMKIAAEIGRIKREMKMDVTSPARETLLRQNILQACKERKDINMSGHMSTQQAEEAVMKFLNYLINESINLQLAAQGEKNCCDGDYDDHKYDDGDYDAPTHLSIFAKAKKAQKSGIDVIHMEVGEPDFMPPQIIKKTLEDSYDPKYTKYGSPQGMPELLDALASNATKRFKAAKEMSAKNVIVTPGGRFAVFAAMTSIINPNDEVIIIRPAWPAYQNCATHLSAKVRAIDTTIKESWMPQTSKIRDAINENTKMIVLNYPNNPTGKILPAHMLDEIIKMAEENNLYVLSDEIYADYTMRTVQPQKSVISYKYDKCIAVQSFSKSHAMTGFRIGYAMTADADIISKMKTLSALCLTSVASPMQHAALHALDADTAQNVNVIRDRLEMLMQKMRQMNVDFVDPDGGMYLFVRLPANAKNSSVFADELLQKSGIAIAPGAGFGPAYHDYIRISVACEDIQRLSEGTDKLMSVLNER